MRPLVVDATTLIALGRVGELQLLSNFDGEPVVPGAVREEVTTDPASSNVERFCSKGDVLTGEPATPGSEHLADARELLGTERTDGDVEVIGLVLAHRASNEGSGVGVVSDDRRVRTVAEGLDATVTGTVGVVVRAVHEGMDPADAKALVRRIDAHGLHMTGELRETADRLVEEAAENGG